ncbi:MAG: hypothetical protein HQL46_08500 [Gammaproteobacteria bacterium]|nr:hypothetical protein [Gammaproteobacteria bacterium]
MSEEGLRLQSLIAAVLLCITAFAVIYQPDEEVFIFKILFGISGVWYVATKFAVWFKHKK